MKNVEKLWIEFKTIIDSNPTYVNAKKIMSVNTKLLKACHKLVLSIENNSSQNAGFFDGKDQELIKTINISGKQRMLSQRLCLYYIASSMFKDNKDEYKNILENVYNEFDTVIGDLLVNSYNTTQIEEELGTVMAEWEKFQVGKKEFMDNGFRLEDVFVSTNKLTKSFNTVTGRYESLSAQN